jgi:hypothetical protein|eukprot:CAMPEP_0185580060 /NCGR_PEP_ID=MMETSP0434-20130131/15586_1 /TAXON_ID=626734 ORGANISM="Favella taraikaensis, Strain Fe Narragansett Bay" /NCGR_SAMPLE_ID=MMETSP0434 /ASSEMBLY_ACC=CAM_ASM_000379 /LENGTH=69 /DNA_ID=CAMNT_0028198223 /DNA_START=27 /DNA_END=236 /DNA_ORIENTATION=-
MRGISFAVAALVACVSAAEAEENANYRSHYQHEATFVNPESGHRQHARYADEGGLDRRSGHYEAHVNAE